MKKTEENIKFLQQNPNAKCKWVKITKELKDMSEKWYKNAMHPNDKSTINYLKKIDAKKYAPIILHQYGNNIKIIDGWHRLYAAIHKDCNKIKAYLKVY
jgi:hypothetical protein